MARYNLQYFFRASIIFIVKKEGYDILQKKITVLQLVTSCLFYGFSSKKTVASLVVICFIREKAQ